MAFSPCGQGLALLRSCYRTQIRFVNGDPTQQTTIQWYFCDPACQPLPYWSSFGSINWWSGQGNPLLGEVQGAPRPWVNGAKVGHANTCRATVPASWWADGQPIGSPPLAVAADGTPLACLAGNVWIGGGSGGGRATYSVNHYRLAIGGGEGNGPVRYSSTVSYTLMGGSTGGGTGTHHASVVFSASGGGKGDGSCAYHLARVYRASGGGKGDGSCVEETVVYPQQATIWPDEMTVVAGSWVYNPADPNQIYDAISYNASGALNDEVQAKFFLKAGSYTLWFLYVSYLSHGITRVYIDGVAQTPDVDQYSAGLGYNQQTSIPITVVGDGVHTITLKVVGKNGASSGYVQAYTKLWIK